MAIKFESKVQDGVLHVRAVGKDESPEQVLEYGMAVIQEAMTHGVTRVLCDERNLEYALGTFDIFETARQIAEMAPRIARVAIVCSPQFFEDGKFWETVAVNRGLQAFISINMDKALAWLAEGYQPAIRLPRA